MSHECTCCCPSCPRSYQWYAIDGYSGVYVPYESDDSAILERHFILDSTAPIRLDHPNERHSLIRVIDLRNMQERTKWTDGRVSTRAVCRRVVGGYSESISQPDCPGIGCTFLEHLTQHLASYHRLLDHVEERFRSFANQVLLAGRKKDVKTDVPKQTVQSGSELQIRCPSTESSAWEQQSVAKPRLILKMEDYDLFQDSSPLQKPSTPTRAKSAEVRPEDEIADGEQLLTFEECSALLHLFDWILYFIPSACSHETDERDSPLSPRSKTDSSLLYLPFRSEVPKYYANAHVSLRAVYTRKILSILGLRNLLHYGPSIFRELQAHHFTGDRHAYASDTGLNKMLRYTGNVVDMDTTVLRCTGSTLATVNKMNVRDGLVAYASPDAFAHSLQAQSLVRVQAEALIRNFCERVAFVALEDVATLKQRRLWIPPGPFSIPVVTSNTDRGRYPIWHYVSHGVNSFHVNVPTLEDVVGSLLYVPVYLLRAFLISCEECWVASYKETPLRNFFNDAVSDGCFDVKWKVAQRYCEQRQERIQRWRLQRMGRASLGGGASEESESIPTIRGLLSTVQRKYQERFTSSVMSSEENEALLVYELLCAEHGSFVSKQGKKGAPQSPMGLDSSGNYRTITREDVLRWVQDPSCSFLQGSS